MARWKLAIRDGSSSLWARSTVNHDIFVEANSEILARLKAVQKFGIAVNKVQLGEDQPTSPWLDPSIVSCRRI